MKNIYTDMANLSAECKYKKISIDMDALYTYLSEKYKADNLYIFTGYLSKYDGKYKANEALGFKYIFKEALFNKDENKIKANCDIDIGIKGTVDTIESELREASLITSDGDYVSLVRFWIDRGVRVRLISPADADRCSYLLKKTNISITFMTQIQNKFINEKALDEN
jgi:uncharacterized LabA/DUF88 family protein